jgi:phosphate transport system substrate-binding protein
MLKQWRMALILGAAMAMSIFISACGGSSSSSAPSGSTPGTGNTPSAPSTPGSFNCVSGIITAAGSTVLAPLVTAMAKDYQAKCPSAAIIVNLGGSNVGLMNVESGSIQIGNSDVFKKAGQDDLVDHQVAVVVFTLVVNPKVTGVTNLTTPQIKGIYSGSITNWNQVGGPNLPIVEISRPITSGTRATFQTYILGGPETIQGPASLVTDNTATVVTEINQTAGAIGYVTVGAAESANLTTVNIDGNASDPTLVENNIYKFWNIEHMYTKGPATGLAQALINYMSSDQGKQEAASLSFIAITDMQQTALQAHQPTS